MISKQIKNIGWIGTGVMGQSMCKHLLKNNYNLNIFSRTLSKTEELQSLGANVMDPQEIAQKSDIIFLMLGYPHDVKSMVFDQLYPHLKKGQVLIDHTTSSPDLAKEIYQKLKQDKGTFSIDAPVTGGDMGARAGQLTIMCGGDKVQVEDSFKVMSSYGAHLHYVGEAGLGQHTKMGNQVVIASYMLGVVEGLLYAHIAGLDVDQFIDIIKNGSARSHSLVNFGPKMVAGDYEPGFYVEHFAKDMDIVISECNKMQLALPGMTLVRQFYQALMAQGGARNGTQALIKVLEQMNNTSIRK